MRRPVRIILIAILVALLVALAVGCGLGRQAFGPEGPHVEVRLPPADAVELRFQEKEPAPPPQSPPFSVTDESAGRWLTLFELNVSPSEAAGVPRAPAESPTSTD